jgi:lipopolysaccharide/colanic/teichoic acid biosynthesis glycosyltransferase
MKLKVNLPSDRRARPHDSAMRTMAQVEQAFEIPGQTLTRINGYSRIGFGHDGFVTDVDKPSDYQPTTSTRRNEDLPKAPGGTRNATIVDKKSLGETGRRHESFRPQVYEVLSKSQFLKQLRLEKRRTERSRVPLSIVLFQFECISPDDLCDVNGLFEILHKNTRETDIAGYLDDDLVALLLLDTDAQGANAFTKKLTKRLNGLRCTTSAATYPDCLFENLTRGSEDTQNLNPASLDNLPNSPNVEYFLKRSVDVVGASVAISLFAPLMLITAAAVKMTSPGPVIFKQARLGKGGVPFVFYKFRSMHCNVDDSIHRDFVTSLIGGDHQSINQQDSAKPYYKLKSDPRITRLGKILRKTSLDELPQLLCVLKGDMSLVGPRPPLPYEAEKYQPWHLRRVLETKPGITGVWQVEGRSKVCFDDMVRMDLRYVRNCSLALDFKILLKTLVVVLRREGAA